MRLGCRDNCFHPLSFDGACAVIADLGLEGVDVSVSDRHHQIEVADVLADPAGSGARTRAVLERHGLVAADAFFLNGNPGGRLLPTDSPDPDVRSAAREQFGAYLDFAIALGTPGVTVLPGSRWPDDREAGVRVAAEELQWRAEQAAAVGLRLSVEIHVQANVRRPPDARRLLDLAPGLELTLDLSHFRCLGETQEAADQLLDRVGHVQFRQGRSGNIQAGRVDGELDLARLVGQLQGLGYDGWVSAEWIVAPYATAVDVLTETAEWRDDMRRLLAHGRTG